MLKKKKIDLSKYDHLFNGTWMPLEIKLKRLDELIRFVKTSQTEIKEKKEDLKQWQEKQVAEKKEKPERKRLQLGVLIEQNGVIKKEKNIRRNIVDKEDKIKNKKITKDRHGKTYFWCACHGHMITIWWDDDERYQFDLVELSFWDAPNSYYGWLEKLKHIWHIIRHGSPYADNITLDSEECELFIDVLQEYVAKAKAAKARSEDAANFRQEKN